MLTNPGPMTISELNVKSGKKPEPYSDQFAKALC